MSRESLTDLRPHGQPVFPALFSVKPSDAETA
jgi:hypothetical protein